MYEDKDSIDPQEIIGFLNFEIYKRDRIITNYDSLIDTLRGNLNSKNSEKDKTIADLKNRLADMQQEGIMMLQRKAYLRMFLQERCNIKLEELDEFITEKKVDARKKKNEQSKQRRNDKKS